MSNYWWRESKALLLLSVTLPIDWSISSIGAGWTLDTIVLIKFLSTIKVKSFQKKNKVHLLVYFTYPWASCSNLPSSICKYISLIRTKYARLKVELRGLIFSIKKTLYMYNIYQIFSTLDHAPPGLPGSYSLQLKNSQSAFFLLN